MEPTNKQPSKIFQMMSELFLILGTLSIFLDTVDVKFTVGLFGFSIIFLLNYLIKYK
jgi:hypothetical protein